MTQIICLANSFKFKERCIAGINPQTGKWIRPVCDRYPKDGRIPPDIRLIKGKEPELLDLLEIPLKNDGPDFGFESGKLNNCSRTMANHKKSSTNRYNTILRQLLKYSSRSKQIRKSYFIESTTFS